jgi:OFA family oxalate/formate antiporter-like MFS transporter
MDDRYLNIVIGSVCSICNGGFRIVFGLGYDYFKFRIVFTIMMMINIIIFSTIYFVNDNKYLYAIYIGLAAGVEGGNFAIFPTFTVENFGIKIGTKVYTYVSFGVVLATFG